MTDTHPDGATPQSDWDAAMADYDRHMSTLRWLRNDQQLATQRPEADDASGWERVAKLEAAVHLLRQAAEAAMIVAGEA